MIAGQGTNPYIPADPPSKPKLPRCFWGLRPPLAKWVRAQNCGGNPKKAKTGRTAPFQQCRGRFSRTYSPASQCPCRHQRWTPLAPPERHSSLTDFSGTTSIPINWHQRPGLPLWLSECQEEKAQLKAGVRLVAAVAGRFRC